LFTLNSYELSDTKKYMIGRIGKLAWPVVV